MLNVSRTPGSRTYSISFAVSSSSTASNDLASNRIKDNDSRYSVTFFVKNLFDKNYYVTSQGSNLLPSNLNLVEKYAIRPKNADRYLGLTVGFKF